MRDDNLESTVLSVVSPIYNGALYLEPFLQSILSQTFSNFELIMVDDGSTDRSVNIIQSYQKKDPRIHIIKQNHKGAGSARNLGLSQAKGEYIIFLDCDDWFSDDFFKTMLDHIKKDRSDIVICEYYLFNQKTSEIKRVKIPDTMGKKFEETNLLFDLFAPSPWTKLYRTIFLKKNHLLFQEIPSCNDWSLAYTALACAKKISVIRRPLLYYRSQISSSISSNRFRRTGDIVQAIKHLKHELKKRNLFDRYKEGFGRRSANHLIYEAFGGRRWGGFYILFRNLVIVNDYFVYKAFLCEVVKRLEKLLNNFFN